MAAVVAVPLVACVPVQPPDAVHDVALVLDQVSVVVAPLSTLVGAADRVTVGTAGGGGGSLESFSLQATRVARQAVLKNSFVVCQTVTGRYWLILLSQTIGPMTTED